MKPGYKQTEVGVIPEEWEVVQLSAVTTQIGDGLHGTPVYSSNGSYFFINGNNLIGGKITVNNETQMVEKFEFIKHRKPLGNGSILMSINGTIGNLAIFENEPVMLGKSVAFINVSPHISKIFIYHSLQELKVKQQFFNDLTGSTIGNLGLTSIRATKIPLPPLPEQIAIAEVLSDMDALIASTEALISKKRALKQATMQQLLTGQKRLPGFHGEWEVKRLEEVAEIDPENIGSYPPNYSFNYIALEDVTRGTLTSYTYHILSTAPSRARRKLRVGDILFATVRPNLQSHLLFVKSTDNWVCSTGFCVIRSLQKLAIPEFIYFHLFFSYVNKQIDSLLTGSNYPAVNSRDVGNLTIPLPPLPEQIAIAEVLSDMNAELDALASQLAKTRALKQGMMQELLTGRTRLI